MVMIMTVCTAFDFIVSEAKIEIMRKREMSGAAAVFSVEAVSLPRCTNKHTGLYASEAASTTTPTFLSKLTNPYTAPGAALYDRLRASLELKC